MMKQILFLSPIGKDVPTGGMKVIYDYSNRLIEDGVRITIAYAAYFDSTENTIRRRIKAIAKYIYAKVVFGTKGYSWYKKDQRIKEIFVWEPSYKSLPKADVYIATAVNTASYISALPAEKAKKIYFIQDYEAFVVNNDSYIKWTYRLPLNKIVISQWLAKLIAKERKECIVIPNGFDFKKFKMTIPVEKKDKYLLSMLYHVDERKDVKFGIKAVELARKEIPKLKLVMFGAYPAPYGLPKWITYFRMPSNEKHLEINNQAAIYVGCSKIEGWGLTVGEAMMCGQAVICTDNDGYKEMATNNVNALISPCGDAEALSKNIIRLVVDDDLRYKLAYKGLETIRVFDFEKSYSMFRDYITSENEG